MNKPKISFDSLRHFLADIGFVETLIPKSHIVFTHADTGTEIMMPIYRANQMVAPRHLVATRVMLDAKGVLDSDEFNDFVESHSEKQSAS